MNNKRPSSTQTRASDKARLLRRAERQRGRLRSQADRLRSRLDPRTLLSGDQRPGAERAVASSSSTFYPLVVGAVGLIVPRLIRRHPVLRVAALGWSAYQFLSGFRRESGSTQPGRRGRTRAERID
jgi:hypothetical protein